MGPGPAPRVNVGAQKVQKHAEPSVAPHLRPARLARPSRPRLTPLPAAASRLPRGPFLCHALCLRFVCVSCHLSLLLGHLLSPLALTGTRPRGATRPCLHPPHLAVPLTVFSVPLLCSDESSRGLCFWLRGLRVLGPHPACLSPVPAFVHIPAQPPLRPLSRNCALCSSVISATCPSPTGDLVSWLRFHHQTS